MLKYIIGLLSFIYINLFAVMPFLDKKAAFEQGRSYPEIKQRTSGPLFGMPSRILGANSEEKPLPTTGVLRIIIIPVNYSDLTLQLDTTTQFLSNLFFSTNFGSLFHYYYHNSYGQLLINGIVSDPVTVSGTRASYIDSSGETTQADAFAREAGTSFAQNYATNISDLYRYDTNADRFIDLIIFYHAGQGGETATNSADNNIHSHMKSFLFHNSPSTNIFIKSNTNYLLGKYIIAPEVINKYAFFNSNRSTIGTVAHEFGHVLGLADLYNVSSSASKNDNSVGSAALMDVGSYNFNRSYLFINGIYACIGSCPAPIIGFHKKFLGWIDYAEPKTGLNIISNYSAGSSIDKLIYKVSAAKEKEYFLIEFRNGSLYDEGLISYPYYLFFPELFLTGITAKGILIWHIDESIYEDYYLYNAVNVNMLHRAVDIEEATGFQYLDAGYYLSTNSLWHDSIAGISDTTTPDAHYYDTEPSGLTIKHISKINNTMSFNVSYINYEKFNTKVYPDPFNPEKEKVTISIALNNKSNDKVVKNYQILITTLSGRVVKVIDVDDIYQFRKTTYEIFLTTWDGRDTMGRLCNIGTYLYKLRSSIKSGIAGTISVVY